MAVNKAGWYPNPDGSANQRKWDGNAWTAETREYPAPNTVPMQEPQIERVSNKGIKSALKSRAFLVSSVVALVIILIAVVSAVGNNSSSATSKPISTSAKATPSATPSATKSSAPTPRILAFGAPITTPNYSIVVNSVEVLDQIDTTSGSPIVADPGTKLVLVHTTISITGNAIDLSCGSAAAIFMHAYDSNGSELANVFEGNRIPGNPECNYKTSAGETVSWNIAYKMAADRTPLALSVIDTSVAGSWGPEILASLQ